MKTLISAVLLLISSAAFADPTVFGMRLGATTEAQLKAMYAATLTGQNKYTLGNMYSLPVDSIDFRDLQSVQVIFDANGKLAAVLCQLPKHKFDYLNKSLAAKYKRTKQKIPFVGNKLAKFRNGNTEITLDAPHLSFDMEMNYITDSLQQKFKQQSQTEKRNTERKEASQL